MSIPISEGFLFTNPVPPQQWERKLVSGITYADWASTAEIDTFFATTTGLSPTYKYNKYFWIAGNLYFHDGTTYVFVGGGNVPLGSVQGFNYTIPSSGLMIINFTDMIGKEFLTITMKTTTYNQGNGITLGQSPNEPGDLDCTAVGGFADAGSIITILYK